MIKNKRILVTGGAGFIGSNIAEALCRDNEVIVLDNLFSGFRENIDEVSGAGRVKFVEGDVTDPNALKQCLEGVDYVFHHAAQISVPDSLKDPVLTDRFNVRGTLNILQASADAGVEKLVMASSAAVYGNDAPVPIDEGAPLDPISPYGASKVAGEQYCLVYDKSLGLRTTVLRYFNVFGPRQSPESVYAAVVPRFIGACLEGKLPTIFGDGQQTRDLVFVEDVVQANIAAAGSRNADGKIFNIGLGQGISVLNLARVIMGKCDLDGEPDFTEERPGDIMHSYADVSRARTVLGFSPEYSVEAGLDRTIAWFKNTG